MFTTRTLASAGALAVAAAILAATGTTGSADAPTRGGSGAERIVREAQSYVGDPWEQRFREQFWARQHVHDSWNRCHLGENAPRPAGCDGTSLTPVR